MNLLSQHVAKRANARKEQQELPVAAVSGKQRGARRIAVSKLRNANEELELAVTALRVHEPEEAKAIGDTIKDLKLRMKKLLER